MCHSKALCRGTLASVPTHKYDSHRSGARTISPTSTIYEEGARERGRERQRRREGEREGECMCQGSEILTVSFLSCTSLTGMDGWVDDRWNGWPEPGGKVIEGGM